MIDPAAFRPFDLGSIMAQGQQMRAQQEALDFRRQEMEERQQQRAQLADLLPRAMGGEAKALQGLAGVDPEAYSRIEARRQTQEERARTALSRIAGRVRTGFRYEDRRAALQRMAPTLAQFGVTAEQLAGFDPTDENLNVYETLGTEPQNPTNLQREVEYMESRRPGSGDRYLDNRADPLVQMDVNGDGIPDIAPRSYVTGRAGGTQPQPTERTAFNPQTGERIRFRLNPQTQQWEPVQGGASQPGSRPFP